MNNITKLETGLNSATSQTRLEALEALMKLYRGGEIKIPDATGYVNNHIHTTYSFSPYSPACAAYKAWLSGLTTAGIMDHDSIAGAREFIEAGKMIGIAATAGFECRCKMDNTPFAGKRINNPDQNSVAYLACHGIPHQNIEKTQDWLTPYRQKRNARNRLMVDNINKLLGGSGITLDFDRDVASISQDKDGGSITERHILYALSLRIIDSCGKGAPVLDFLSGNLGISVTGKTLEKLLDAENTMYDYYLLGALKSDMVEKFYIDASDECPDVSEFLAFTQEIGAISAYAYLGDVGDSVTGDKKAQTFEDSYLDELVGWLSKAGFKAITYMPSRNTSQQLARLIGLCEKNGLFQISGEDINSPFQSFICDALALPQYQHLTTSTWALIGHELSATKSQEAGMFTDKTIAAMPGLEQRVNHFADYGKAHCGAASK